VDDVTARGDIIVTDESTVLIGSRPAARVGDVTAQGDVITTGEPTVLIGGRPAARVGGVTAQGGVIVTGGATVLIGSDPTVQEARKHIGSTAWAYKADRPPYPAKTNKCNLFVYETLNDSSKPVPMRERWSWSRMRNVDHPPLAGQWADPSVEIPGWEVVTDPRPGDVAAIARDYSDASGHVGIVSGPNSTISATGEKVIEQ